MTTWNTGGCQRGVARGGREETGGCGWGEDNLGIGIIIDVVREDCGWLKHAGRSGEVVRAEAVHGLSSRNRECVRTVVVSDDLVNFVSIKF